MPAIVLLSISVESLDALSPESALLSRKVMDALEWFVEYTLRAYVRVFNISVKGLNVASRDCNECRIYEKWIHASAIFKSPKRFII